ncbi:hypothetical protein Tco_1006280 [Tanacetum coccineum]|uniref:HORMA domain-containing protein n=1 Tax=Tanacetum coccineum TaxID=301880 RepID=A0ABQ5FHI8_9ASTR
MTQFLHVQLKVQEKTQLLRSKCMNSLRAIQSQFKFLTETLQDFGLAFELDSQTGGGIHAPLWSCDAVTLYKYNAHQVRIIYKQLDKDEFQEDESMAAFWVVNTQFQKFINSQFTLDYESQMTDKYFVEYTRIEMQTQVRMIDTGKIVDNGLVVMKSNGTESEVQDESSKSGNDTDVDDADIRPIYDEESMAEVQLTAECNSLLGLLHTEQPEIINKGRVNQYPEKSYA